MNYYQIQEHKKEVYPAILLDRYISPLIRKAVRYISFWATVASFIALLFSPTFVAQYVYLTRSAFFFFLSLHLLFVLLEMMYRSCYFTKTKVDIRVLNILESLSKTSDITRSFLSDGLGRYTMHRLGFTDAHIKKFLKTKTDTVTAKEFEIIENNDDEVSFAEFGYSLLHFDSDLSQLCKERGITHLDFKQALEWTYQLDQKSKEKQRWWTRDNLLRLPSVGVGLSFGQIYYLAKLGHPMNQDTAFIQLGEKYKVYSDMLLQLESVLSKTRGGNVMLTANESYITKDVLASLARQIEIGRVFPTIEHKRLYILETSLLISNYEDPSQFEIIFQKTLNQAAEAGNIILILTDFAGFIEHAHRIQVDVKSILKEALEATDLHVISTSNERDFHQYLETDLDLMTYFEKIHIAESDTAHAILVLQEEILYTENKYNVFFTFKSIKRIVESADRYFADMSLLDKSLDILEEVVFFAKQNGSSTITVETIDELMSQKTGLNLGKVSKQEAYKMAHIKEYMGEKIIGQSNAVAAVCDAMIRARSGLANSKRPLASFLFVGPTGVGKTETAKVLAELFFGNEEAMVRSDMSEYSGADSIERMIGTPQTPGVFASKIKEKGSGVLLLDEFEKASLDVHNLFLQIIDEGFFTDARGERITMRNFIIIATSNAGSILWANNQSVDKDELVKYIINQNIFKAELLNRFDDVVAFNTLEKEAVKQIVELACDSLVERLESRGITLKKNQALLDYIVSKTSHSEFGAREINRVVKKELESKIAQALVLGDLFEGDTISFTTVDNQLQIQKYT